MVDYLTEIPLTGRTIASPLAVSGGEAAQFALPSFVAGPENRLAAATFDQLLEGARPSHAENGNAAPNRIAPAVLALFGPSGVGKTHLAHGLVKHWQNHRGAESALYITAGDFRRQLLAAMSDDAVVEFRRLVRDRQLLAIDDLHQLPPDNYLVQELRFTLDECEENGGIVVVTSARPASALANLSPDVRSRLASGLALQLSAPAAAARMRIIQQASKVLGQTLSEDAAHCLATGVPGTASELFGALFELLAAPPQNSTSDATRTQRLLAARAARRPTLREVLAIVAKYTGVPQKQLKSSSRRQTIVLARGIVVYLARELAGSSYDQIGRALGGRDHTTIMHNYRKIDRDRAHDPAIQEALDELRRILISR